MGPAWMLQMIEALDLQAIGYTGAGVTVCLVDTGIDVSHPDLARANLVAWRDFINNRSTPYDDDGHGTGMAGLILANGTGFRGTAPGASLIVAKALDASGMGTSLQVGLAIRFCLDPNGDGNPGDGAAIVSLSLSAARAPIRGSDIDQAVTDALSRGVFVIAAAGNDGGPGDDGDVQSPSSIPRAISVGAVDEIRLIAPFSSAGDNRLRADPHRKPEVVAPGERLVSDARGGGYQVLGGTSAATALTAGLLALVLQARPSYARTGSIAAIDAFKSALMASAAPAPGQATPHDDHYGYGILQGLALVRRL